MRTPRTFSIGFLAALPLLALLLWSLAGCQKDTRRKSDAELGLTPQQARGRRIYDAHCLVCHEAYSKDEQRGPTLMGMYKKRQLASGAPANDERVRDAIVMGRAKMPGYGNLLTPQQVDDLIAYMHTL
ncbi:MAG TPA: cytochrome c [Terriglobales bacterium]|nr:cytochrome c [Terriglobales bacterium]